MKRWLIILFLGTTLIIIGLIAIRINRSLREKEATLNSIITMPTFSYMTLTDKLFVSANIIKGPVIIVNYHPECEHCRYEIGELVKSGIAASGVEIIFISSAEKDEQIKFLEESGIDPFGSFTFLTDPAITFGKIFGSKSVPAIYIYDEALQLIKSFQGEVRIETIEKTLRQSGQD